MHVATLVQSGMTLADLPSLGFPPSIIACSSVLQPSFEGKSIRKKFVHNQYGIKWKRGISLIPKKGKRKENGRRHEL